MKHCKRILALVLVIATLLSFTLVAGAATVQYTDANQITHEVAVDVLSAIGVINGYEDGSFKPTSSVTRAEMAKILAFVLNGGEDVGESYTSACTFADSQNHWAKGYIGFCVSAGLINGKNANTFDPDGQVTGYEVAKMLLCALGYKADLNGLTGSEWNTNAHSLAIKANLLTYLQNYAPAASLNRDDSCQMILNALQATMVESAGSTTSIAGISIVSDAANTPLANTASSYTAPSTDNLLQLVEDVFPTLKLVSSTTHDAFGRPATEWKLNGASLGVCVMKPLLSTNATMSGSGIKTAIGDAIVNSAEVFVNGESYGTVDVKTLTEKTGLSAATIKTQDYVNTAAKICTGFGGSLKNSFSASVLAQVLRGYTGSMKYSNSTSDTGSTRATYTYYTEAFFDAATGKVTLINNNTYFGKVTSVRNPVTDAEGNITYPGYILVSPITGSSNSPYADIEVNDNITIPGGALLPILLDDVNTDGNEASVKVGDYVCFDLGRPDPAVKAYCAENAKLMRRDTVTVAQTTQAKSGGSLRSYDTIVDMNDTTYYPANANGETTLHTVGVTYDLITVTLGSRNYFYRTEAVLGNYMYLYNADNSQDLLAGGFEAKLVNSDGSITVVETDQLYRNSVGSIVYATTNAAGKTVLTSVGSYSGNFNVKVNVKNSNSSVTFDDTTMIADTNTVFVISQVDSSGKESFTTYTGIHNVPDIQSGQYYAYVTNESGILDTVFIINAAGVTSSKQEGVVFKVDGKDLRFTGEGGVAYYQLPAIMNGEVTTVKMTERAYRSLSVDGFHPFNAYTTDAYGNIDSITEVSGKQITQFAPAAAGNIFINETPMTYHDNVLVYTYSVAAKALAVSTVEALYALDSTFASYYTLHEDYSNKPLAAILAIIP